MFIGVVGPKSSGKNELTNYLIEKLGFTQLHLRNTACNDALALGDDLGECTDRVKSEAEQTCFDTAKELLDYVTPRWDRNYVITNVTNPIDLCLLRKRPFFLIVNVDAPLGLRYRRYCKRMKSMEFANCTPLSLEEFIEQDDKLLYSYINRSDLGNGEFMELIPASDSTAFNSNSSMQTMAVYSTENGTASIRKRSSSYVPPMVNNSPKGMTLQMVLSNAQMTITNTFDTLGDLYTHLDALDLLNTDRLRPSWDTYFMLLSELASYRSNCMKRKVGCILVKDNQIIATGYNGTPKGIANCNEGGCPRCNDGTPCGVSLDHCLCIHAEENALLEAGRGRVRSGNAVALYCNTCPCLGCAKKIVQVGVKEVIYSKGYGMDELTLNLFAQAGITVRQHTPPTININIGSP